MRIDKQVRFDPNQKKFYRIYCGKRYEDYTYHGLASTINKIKVQRQNYRKVKDQPFLLFQDGSESNMVEFEGDLYEIINNKRAIKPYRPQLSESLYPSSAKDQLLALDEELRGIHRKTKLLDLSQERLNKKKEGLREQSNKIFSKMRSLVAYQKYIQPPRFR